MNPSPGPWRWRLNGGDGDVWALDDADGNPIVGPGGLNYITVASEERSLIAAAPEMREMLLKLEWTDEFQPMCPCCSWPERHQPGCALASLLDRIR